MNAYYTLPLSPSSREGASITHRITQEQLAVLRKLERGAIRVAEQREQRMSNTRGSNGQ